jgi:hypothetical protein
MRTSANTNTYTRQRSDCAVSGSMLRSNFLLRSIRSLSEVSDLSDQCVSVGQHATSLMSYTRPQDKRSVALRLQIVNGYLHKTASTRILRAAAATTSTLAKQARFSLIPKLGTTNAEIRSTFYATSSPYPTHFFDRFPMRMSINGCVAPLLLLRT